MKRLIFLFAVLFFLPSTVYALSIPEKPQSYVNDYAGLLSGQAREQIERTLADFERETSNQVVVGIFQSLEGEVLEDFSIRLAEKWKAGQKDKDNGVILLIFKDDRAVRIEVGYGLEGALPDALASQIIYSEIVPAFKAGNFDTGVWKGVQAIIQATKGEYTAPPSGGMQGGRFEWVWLFALLPFYIVFPLAAYFAVFFMGMAFFGSPLGFLLGVPGILALMCLRVLFYPLLFGQTLTGKLKRRSAFETFIDRAFGPLTGSGSRKSGWSSGGSWGGSGGGGGFSSGGGSFGGGGASGRW